MQSLFRNMHKFVTFFTHFENLGLSSCHLFPTCAIVNVLKHLLNSRRFFLNHFFKILLSWYNVHSFLWIVCAFSCSILLVNHLNQPSARSQPEHWLLMLIPLYPPPSEYFCSMTFLDLFTPSTM